MKRFKFPLRPVAILRAHQELKAREAFAASVQAFINAEKELAAARERVRLLASSLTAGREGTFSVQTEIQALLAYRRECTAEADSEKALEASRKAMDARRSEYVEAHRRLEVVNRLEQKAKATYRYETGREEQAEFDDYSNRRFGRRANLSSA